MKSKKLSKREIAREELTQAYIKAFGTVPSRAIEYIIISSLDRVLSGHHYEWVKTGKTIKYPQLNWIKVGDENNEELGTNVQP